MKFCKNCGRAIEWKMTPIDDFWYHFDSGFVYCNVTPWAPGKWDDPVAEEA